MKGSERCERFYPHASLPSPSPPASRLQLLQSRRRMAPLSALYIQVCPSLRTNAARDSIGCRVVTPSAASTASATALPSDSGGAARRTTDGGSRVVAVASSSSPLAGRIALPLLVPTHAGWARNYQERADSISHVDREQAMALDPSRRTFMVAAGAVAAGAIISRHAAAAMTPPAARLAIS